VDTQPVVTGVAALGQCLEDFQIYVAVQQFPVAELLIE